MFDKDEDIQAMSRPQLKKQLKTIALINDPMELSLADSANQLNSMFPAMSQPTFELSQDQQPEQITKKTATKIELQDEQYSNKYIYAFKNAQLLKNQTGFKNQIKHITTDEDFKNQKNKKNKNEFKNKEPLAVKIAQLTHKYDMKNNQLQEMTKKCEKLEEKVRKQQKQLKIKDQMYRTLKNVEKQNKNEHKNQVSQLCAQMLSPQETVELLETLLKKVNQSSKMIRHLSNLASTQQIIAKLSKK